MFSWWELQVKRKIDLVYGGGSVGLMGLISQRVFDGGCRVLGYVCLKQTYFLVLNTGALVIYWKQGVVDQCVAMLFPYLRAGSFQKLSCLSRYSFFCATNCVTFTSNNICEYYFLLPEVVNELVLGLLAVNIVNLWWYSNSGFMSGWTIDNSYITPHSRAGSAGNFTAFTSI